jgi:uncharacterized protein Yka (UPF0111/DUF47 family)
MSNQSNPLHIVFSTIETDNTIEVIKTERFADVVRRESYKKFFESRSEIIDNYEIEFKKLKEQWEK